MSSPQPHALRRLAETLVVGAAGGATLGMAGFPAGWMSGSIVAVSICAIAGRPVLFPNGLAMVVFVVMGTSLGAAVTPATLEQMAAWPLSMAALAVSMGLLTLSVTLYLKFVHGWDALSALFAAAPGGLAQALALATQCGSDVRSVAMVQSVRLLLLTVIMPIGLATFAATGNPPLPGSRLSVLDSPGELAILILACTLAAAFAYRMRVPGGLIVGAMAASGILHGSGAINIALPTPITITSFVMTGAMIGSRFAGMNFTLLLRMMGVGLGALAVGGLVAIGCAIVVAWLLSLRTGDVIMAYAPGGLEAMTILSFALHLNPAFVGIHHLARFVFVSIFIPIAVRVLRPPDSAPPPDPEASK
jgi:uncharacterized protein